METNSKPVSMVQNIRTGILTPKNIPASWKMTVAGMVTAGVYAWANDAHMDFKHCAVAVAIAMMGYLAKDA
jgi:hypothetical protein